MLVEGRAQVVPVELWDLTWSNQTQAAQVFADNEPEWIQAAETSLTNPSSPDNHDGSRASYHLSLQIIAELMQASVRCDGRRESRLC